MGNYKHIILAVELAPEIDNALINVALDIAKKTGATISLVHAIEQVGAYGGTYGVTIASEIEELLLQNAQKEMQKLASKIGVEEKAQIIKFGTAKMLILDEAEKQKADLIIVGSHGRHGIQVILGSTANAVLHRAKCDVLAVRLKK